MPSRARWGRPFRIARRAYRYPVIPGMRGATASNRRGKHAVRASVAGTLIAVVACLPVTPAAADAAGQANRLMVEAVQLVQASELEPSSAGKSALLREALGNLLAIIERYPSTDLAVRLATGQRVGNISLAGVRQALNDVRGAAPRQAGAPVRAWMLGTGVAAVALPAGGSQALIVGRDGTAALHDVETGELLRTWEHAGGLSDVALSRRGWGGASTAAVSPRGRRALTAGRDGTVQLRAVETGTKLNEWTHDRLASAVALSRDRRLALVGVEREAVLVDAGELTVRRTWRGGSPVTSVAYAPGGQWILAGFADGSAVVGEAATGAVVHTWRHPGSGGGGVMSAAFSSDGRRVVVGAANHVAVLRDVGTGRTLHEWRVGSRVTSVAYSHDGAWVLTADEGYEVELHDARTGKTVRKWRYEASAEAVAITPNGRWALMGFADGTAILCDVRLPERRRGHARTFLTRESGCW